MFRVLHLPYIAVMLTLMVEQTMLAPPPFRMKDWTPEALASYLLRNPCHIRTGGAGSIRDGQKMLCGYRFTFPRDYDDAPLPKVHSHNYSITYPPLQEGDLIPFLGCLYCVGHVNTEKHNRRDGGATRLPAKEVPKGVSLHSDSYTFPLNETEHNGGYISGSLHDRFIYVRRIVASTEKPDSLSAEVGLLGDVSKEPSLRKNEIVWKWVQVGELIDLGEYRHEVVCIVPPREPQELKRGRARMIGWIELSSKPTDHRGDKTGQN